jgi:two-component system, NarL family, sensor histidine kinase UhpB
MIAPFVDFATVTNPINVLHLEDSSLDHQLTSRALRKSGMDFVIQRVESLEDFCELVRSHTFDVILADFRLSGFTALDAWAAVTTLTSQPPPFILLSGAIGEAAAVAAIQRGISDYLHKDNLESLQRVIQRAMEVHRARLEKENADRELAVSEKRITEFAHYLQQAIERDRASISREIHDDIGGSLAATNMDLAWISRHTTDPEILSHLQSATEMLQHAIGASQRIMMSLRPSILDQGLYAAVQWLAAGFERRTGIKTLFSVNNERVTASKSVQLTAYRTVQEALTNILKYANCSLVKIEMSDAEGFLTVEITDNGKGIAEDALQKSQSFGIRGLKERAKTVNGWLDVSSREGHGTSIILSVPISDDDAQEVKF